MERNYVTVALCMLLFANWNSVQLTCCELFFIETGSRMISAMVVFGACIRKSRRPGNFRPRHSQKNYIHKTRGIPTLEAPEEIKDLTQCCIDLFGTNSSTLGVHSHPNITRTVAINFNLLP